ncbi:MAG: hypothetical protein AMXMBFR82_14320 [Candidatus Hydrogenedentota bacterium]
MTAEEVRQTIRDFVRMVDDDSGALLASEARLHVLLDRIALAVSENPVPFEALDYEGGDRADYDERRARVAARFPDLGFYNTPASITQDIADTSITVGDAIEDIVDIASELSAVLKVWDAIGSEEAMRALAGAYQFHIGDHLRELQLYLHARQRIPNPR